MTATPSESPTHADAPLPHPPWTSPPQPRTNLVPWILLAVVVVLMLMAGTGLTVWLLTRQPSTGTLTVSGTVTLKRGQFALNGASDQSKCEGLQSYADIKTGAQVTVTDAGGRALATGALDLGAIQGVDGDGRPEACVLPFKLTNVPSGVGPYGIEVARRGVIRVDQKKLAGVQLGF